MSYERTVRCMDRVGINRVTGERHGVHTPAGSRILWRAPDILIFRRAGYSDNPGSRYSGLRDYYPAEDIAYLIGEPWAQKPQVHWCYALGSTDVSAQRKRD